MSYSTTNNRLQITTVDGLNPADKIHKAKAVLIREAPCRNGQASGPAGRCHVARCGCCGSPESCAFRMKV